MSSLDLTSTTRKPGPYRADRRCAHVCDGGQCITVLHRNHGGRYCYAHEPAHLDEPVAEATLEPERELVAA